MPGHLQGSTSGSDAGQRAGQMANGEDAAPLIEPADGEPTTELPPVAESQRVKMPIQGPGKKAPPRRRERRAESRSEDKSTK